MWRPRREASRGGRDAGLLVSVCPIDSSLVRLPSDALKHRIKLQCAPQVLAEEGVAPPPAEEDAAGGPVSLGSSRGWVGTPLSGASPASAA